MGVELDTIREEMKKVIDPELFVNVIDLGLIYNIQVEPVGEKENINIDMTLTSPACPAGPQIIHQTKTVLSQLPGIGEVHVKLVMTPPWGPEKMSEAARDQLGIF